MDNRPVGREKNVTGQGKDVYRRGSGTGTGPVGSGSRPSGGGQSPGGGSPQRSSGNGPVRLGGGGRSPVLLIILVVVVILIAWKFCSGGGDSNQGYYDNQGQDYYGSQPQQTHTQPPVTQTPASSSVTPVTPSSGDSARPDTDYYSSFFNSYGNVSSGWSAPQNLKKLDTSVAAGSRDKRTVIKGNGNDTVTIMIYMCGTDLESRSGMATSDLKEMASATISDKVNIIVYTGGCKQWRVSGISNSVNQIYQVKQGGLYPLKKDDGSAPMTRPSTLASFIRYCAENFPANRNELILWDHGGGSISGYGYDEKNQSAGSMSLSGINEALTKGGVKFDFVGFDACLMGTLENGLMLEKHADYLIASEETEPGVGWYYTNWLTNLSNNTSLSTLEIGKNIVDDFVAYCNQKCQGQKTTLSVVDLAELANTVPEKLKAFSVRTTDLMKNGEYKAVSQARSNTREFAASTKIDQVDLVHLAYNLNTDESKALADVLLSAVKYNNTSSSITNAYGISIYFPYQKTSKVSSAVASYEAIGMESEYSRCIQQFASMEVSGQAASGGTHYPTSSLYGYGGSSSSSSSSYSTSSSDAIFSLLSELLGGSSYGGVSGLSSENAGFLGRSLDPSSAAEYISANQFDGSALVWTGDEPRIRLSEDQWSLINDLELNVFLDDGSGYIDLGLDNVFEFTDDGALLGNYDGTWLAIDRQPVAYYHTGTVTEEGRYTITGRVPVYITDEENGLNKVRADLLLVFDSDHPKGYIAGARFDYRDGETETVAKEMYELRDGAAIDFLCDYYSYDGDYLDSYMLGDAWTFRSDAEISNVYIDASKARATYKFTDIYHQEYWTPVLP